MVFSRLQVHPYKLEVEIRCETRFAFAFEPKEVFLIGCCEAGATFGSVELGPGADPVVALSLPSAFVMSETESLFQPLG